MDGEGVREKAREVAAVAEAVRSVAAEADRTELHGEIERVIVAARAVDEAAAALVRHALAVEAAGPLPALPLVDGLVRRLLP